jgi:hypothetical protein
VTIAALLRHVFKRRGQVQKRCKADSALDILRLKGQQAAHTSRSTAQVDFLSPLLS